MADSGYNSMDAAAPDVAANVPLPRERPQPSEAGVYAANEYSPLDAAAAARSSSVTRGVNPRLVDAVTGGAALALPKGYTVRTHVGPTAGRQRLSRPAPRCQRLAHCRP